MDFLTQQSWRRPHVGLWLKLGSALAVRVRIRDRLRFMLGLGLVSVLLGLVIAFKRCSTKTEQTQKRIRILQKIE